MPPPRMPLGPALMPFAFAALLAVAGCSGIRLDQALRERADDWPVFAGSAGHANASDRTITPPLKLEWAYELTAGGGSGSPIVIDSTVLVGNLRGELHAVRIRNGKRLGWISLGDAIEGSPAIDGRFAVVALANTPLSLVAYDLVDGTFLWKKDYGDIESTPLIVDRKVYVGNLEGTFSCVDRGTGDLLWKYEIPENRKLLGFRSSPAEEETTVVVGADNGILYGFDEESGVLRWNVNTGAGVVAPPSIDSGTVYVGNLRGRITAIDLATGRVRWQFESSAPVYSLVSLSPELALFGTLEGSVFALRRKDGSVAWKSELGYPVNTGVLIAGNVAYVGTLKRTLFAVDLQDGRTLWKQEVEGRIKTTPAYGEGRIFIVTDDRLLLSFGESAR